MEPSISESAHGRCTPLLDAAKFDTSVLNPATPILIVICGPTATGKSGLAMELTQWLPGAIVSADSRQVYRELNIGTAKPSRVEQQRVSHYLIDICDPTETLTLADYQQDAQTVIQTCHTEGRIPLLVGGTGLYIRSVIRGMIIPRVAPQVELRSQLQSLGQPLCYSFLQQVDPAAAEKIHPHDPTRTIRALEVYYTTGRPISQQQGENPPPYPILQIGLDCLGDPPSHPDADPLTHRIAQRTDQMLQAGLVQEVVALCDRYGPDLPLLNTLGYQEIKSYLAGERSLEDTRSLIILHTRQFAKRQRTWFRADPTIEWFDADHPQVHQQVGQRIQEFLANHAGLV